MSMSNPETVGNKGVLFFDENVILYSVDGFVIKYE